MVLIGTVAAGGCGVGPGSAATGEASLRVTREFGTTELVDATLEDPTPSDTVVRFLDQSAEIDTSYGGNFVDSIEGVAGSTVSGGPEDWFFFVNGSYSDVGAGEVRVEPGDRIWWDYRRWAEAYRVPAVVGSWPEPFLHRDGGRATGTVVECVGEGSSTERGCAAAVASLEREGVEVRREDVAEPVPHPDELRVLVGSWEAVRADPAAVQVEDGPSRSGVYANLSPCGATYALDLLGSDARSRGRLFGSGLLAAVRRGDDEPTWVVAGLAPEAVDDAAALLDAEGLRDRYAVATGPGGEAVPIPAPDSDPPLDDQAGCR